MKKNIQREQMDCTANRLDGMAEVMRSLSSAQDFSRTERVGYKAAAEAYENAARMVRGEA